MLEYAYRLDFPGLLDVVQDKFKTDPFKTICNKPDGVFRMHPKEFLHPDWTSIKNLNWDRLTIFNKPPGAFGVTHTDNSTDNDLRWSINWVFGSGGGMCYWEDDQVIERIVDQDSAGLYRAKYKLNGSPSKNYKTVHNGVYLVNASKIHNGYNESTATDFRYAVSIKAQLTPHTRKWEDVVALFQSSIIGW